MPKKRKLKNFFIFLTSLVVSLAVFSCGIYLFRYEIDYLLGVEPVGEILKTPEAPTNILFCEIDNNVSYKLTLDFEEGESSVEKLYFDNDIYHIAGLSAVKKDAEVLGYQFDYAMVVTETQHAAIIDYVGGTQLQVDKKISEMCSGLSVGLQNVHGIAAAGIFKYEENEEVLCLSIIEDIFKKWTLILDEKPSFFKLLNLCENDFSYTEYIKQQYYFNKFQ